MPFSIPISIVEELQFLCMLTSTCFGFFSCCCYCFCGQPSGCELFPILGLIWCFPNGWWQERHLCSCTCWPFIYLLWRNIQVLYPCFNWLVFLLSPGGSEGKESACNAGDQGFIPGWGRSPGGGNRNPLQYSCLENSMDRRAWQATVHGVTKSQTWLSNFHFTWRDINVFLVRRSVPNTRWSILPYFVGCLFTLSIGHTTLKLHSIPRQWQDYTSW